MLSSRHEPALLLFTFTAFAFPVFGYVPEWIPKNSVNLQDVRRICVGDLNGDGRPDVVTRRHTGNIHVLLTPADGTLGATSLVGSGTDVALADVNGDGKLDLIIADSTTKRLSVAPGNGDGTFGTQVVTNLSIVPDELAVGDFNGDGRAEVLVRTASAPSFTIFRADPVLQFSSVSSTPLSASVSKILIGDLDNDGKSDVVVAYSSPAALVVHYGKGDGTFEPAVPVVASQTEPADVTLGDLNGDGRLDVVTCEPLAGTVTVIRNDGGRKFALPLSYDVHVGKNDPDPYFVLVFDASEDGKPDVVAISGGYSAAITLTGKGDGTLLPPVLDISDAFNDVIPAVADITGDGKPDLIVASYDNLVLMRAAPGEVRIDVTPLYPTISTGQDDSYWVGMISAAEVIPSFPVPQGTVTLLRDGTPVGKADGALVMIDDLAPPLGSHQMTASFAGSANYHAAISAPVTVNVVNEKTTLILMDDHAGQAVPYGTPYLVTASITSPIAGSLTGVVQFYTDGERANPSFDMDPPNLLWRPVPGPGTHTFVVKYEGDAMHPPAQSNAVTQTILKGDIRIGFISATSSVTYGDQPTFILDLEGVSGYQRLFATGYIHVYDGQDLLLTAFLDGSTFSPSLRMPPLPPGVHSIRITYDGDDRYNASASFPLQYTVLAPSTPLPPKKRGVHH